MKIALGDVVVEVIKKNIKNLHLSVYPPHGNVRISAPFRMKNETIRIFAISKLVWIKRQQKNFCEQERELPREYLNLESHYVWGKRYILKIIESNKKSFIELKGKRMCLHIRKAANHKNKQAIVERWYRAQLTEVVAQIIKKWEPQLGVKVNQFSVRKMKTKWGSCNSEKKKIIFNIELAKKPIVYLEYIVIHEMTHLLERKHNDHFKAILNKWIPKWRHYKKELNSLPLNYEKW